MGELLGVAPYAPAVLVGALDGEAEEAEPFQVILRVGLGDGEAALVSARPVQCVPRLDLYAVAVKRGLGWPGAREGGEER